MNEQIKSDKKQCQELKRLLKPEEARRMDLGKTFRTQERTNQRWDEQQYDLLKQQRTVCDDLCSKIQVLDSRIKQNQSEMYISNKSLHNQAIAKTGDTKLNMSNELQSKILQGKAVFQGIDPGIVTTASSVCLTARSLFESINRFQNLERFGDYSLEEEKSYKYELTAGIVNQSSLATSHRTQREKKRKEGKQTRKQKLDACRSTRKIRTKRFHQRYASHIRRKIFDKIGAKKNGSLVSFLGDWSMVGTGIKEHTRRSLKPFVKRLKSVENDDFHVVDEFRSTITCSSCFSITTKQVIRTSENKIRRIKGAVVCKNKFCPRRIKSKSTTTNRDENGARNIALIGFSILISKDGMVLPPYRRSYNSNKYDFEVKQNCGTITYNFIKVRLV